MQLMRKIGEYISYTAQENDFDLFLTVKMETRHPILGSFAIECLAICNHCGVTAA